MFSPRLVSAVLAAFLAVAASACAQEPARSESAIQDAVAGDLPGWWRITEFEFATAPAAETPERVPETGGKVPGELVTGGAANVAGSGKPGADAAALAGATSFTATLELSEDIFEPLYALDGTAIIQKVLEQGDRVDVTGTLVGEGDAAQVNFDQQGVLQIGRPVAAYDIPALVLGTTAADEFLASRDAARAEGTMRKVMSDAGEEL